MTEVSIGMRRERAIALAEEILATPDEKTLDITLYCQTNSIYGSEGEIIVNLSNDDMEREEVGKDTIYVDIEQD